VKSTTWFTSLGTSAPFLDNPLPAPLWKGPGLNSEALTRLRSDWQEIKNIGPAKPENITLAEYRADQPREFKKDFSFCRGQSFGLLRIEDPYVLKDEGRLRSLQQLLKELADMWSSWPKKIEIKTRYEGSNQTTVISELTTALKPHGTMVDVRRVVLGGGKKLDFHDRRVIFQPEAGNSKSRITVLLTGGVDRYMNQRAECGIITHNAY
jgi:hypothetical protein